jgi:hypothetical protein
MIEKMRAIQNPLTVIAIFAALAEIAGTVALATVQADSQGIFIWFVMLFPTFLVACFFLTLNFNPTVLYAPSDFKNEENFLDIIAGSRRLTANLQTIDSSLDTLRREVLGQLVSEVSSLREVDRRRLSELLEQQMGEIRTQLAQTRKSAEQLSFEITSEAYPQSALQARVLAFLAQINGPVEGDAIAQELGRDKAATFRALERLQMRGLVESVGVSKPLRPGMTLCFQLPKAGTKEQPQPSPAN